MTITGIITHELEPESGTGKSGNTWSKQTYVIQEEKDQYPMSLAFENWGDKLVFTIGERCTVHFKTAAKEWNGKWYNSVQAWRKEGGYGAATHRETQQAVAKGSTNRAEVPNWSLDSQQPAAFAQNNKSTFNPQTEEDDLPF